MTDADLDRIAGLLERAAEHWRPLRGRGYAAGLRAAAAVLRTHAAFYRLGVQQREG